MPRRRRLENNGIRTFLDNNIWNAMVSDDESVVEALEKAYRAGLLEIILTVELVEEILATANSPRPERAREMMSLAQRLGGSRLLKPLNQRLVEEAAVPGALMVSRRYMPKKTMGKLEAILNSAQDVGAVIEAIATTKHQTLDLYSAWTDEIVNFIENRGSKRRDFDSTVSSDSIRAIAAPFATDLTNRFEVSAIAEADVGPRTVPSLWYLSAHLAARLTLGAREGRALSPSDHHDGLHCSGGAYFDVFVTEDRKLREALSLIDALPFEVWNAAELKQWLANARPASTR